MPRPAIWAGARCDTAEGARCDRCLVRIAGDGEFRWSVSVGAGAKCIGASLGMMRRSAQRLAAAICPARWFARAGKSMLRTSIMSILTLPTGPGRRWHALSEFARMICASRCARTSRVLGSFTVYRKVLRPFSDQADRAAAELRGAGGDRDGERAAASPRRARRWSSRPRPPRCCRSSIPRPAISRRCSMRCWKRRIVCAVRRLASL